MNIIKELLDFLREFWPFWIVRGDYQRGLRFWLGGYVKELDGKGRLFGIPTFGLYAILPWFGAIEIVDVAPDVLKLFDQNVTTKDDVSVMMAANVAYRIVDAFASFTAIQQLENNLGDAFRRHLAKRVREKTWKELLEGQADLEKSCKGTLTTYVKKWGVEVEDVGFVCFVKTRNLSLANL